MAYRQTPSQALSQRLSWSLSQRALTQSFAELIEQLVQHWLKISSRNWPAVDPQASLGAVQMCVPEKCASLRVWYSTCQRCLVCLFWQEMSNWCSWWTSFVLFAICVAFLCFTQNATAVHACIYVCMCAHTLLHATVCGGSCHTTHKFRGVLDGPPCYW